MTNDSSRSTEANRDPISGAPGAPGAAVGAIVRGLAGKGIAESIDPTHEDAYCRENDKNRPCVGEASRDAWNRLSS